MGAGGSSSRPPVAPVSTLITRERERRYQDNRKNTWSIEDHAS